ncbi:hypothetical protein ACLS0R_14700 [Comamonas jiangduensis]|uniref:hypothetical protein n=1 Tax=Comamonas jiangduensis TaxID=1194168 RepID=UPI003BF8F8A5
MSTAEQAIRNGIKEAAAVLAQDQAISNRPEAFTYVPPTHARALDLDATLIEGIRGAGKSFWFSLLASPKHLSFVRSSFPEARLPHGVKVAQGFGMGLSITQAPDAETLAHLVDQKFRERSIWRAVLAHHIGVGGGFAQLKNWTERVLWVQQNPEGYAHEIEQADHRLSSQGETLLVLFDALDRMADDWQHINRLAKGLLQVALDMRSTRAIRCKVFVRPDLLQDASVTSFADYSKLLATKASLVWHRADLYALLYQCLGNAPVSRKHFAAWVGGRSRATTASAGTNWAVPSDLRQDEDRQEALFERLAGKAMGSSIKRGKPYTWLVNHLQDGLNQVSPRSFLAALGKAATETTDDYQLPLDYRGIQRGVQEASQIRVQEITEDYPWVRQVMEPLRGNLTVPCLSSEIERIWKSEQTLAQLEALLNKGRAAVKLPPQNLGMGPVGILLDLEALGMVQRMDGKRIQMPDVFRVAFGFGRRGGVTPLK